MKATATSGKSILSEISTPSDHSTGFKLGMKYWFVNWNVNVAVNASSRRLMVANEERPAWRMVNDQQDGDATQSIDAWGANHMTTSAPSQTAPPSPFRLLRCGASALPGPNSHVASGNRLLSSTRCPTTSRTTTMGQFAQERDAAAPAH
jgi:hypothetical protein